MKVGGFILVVRGFALLLNIGLVAKRLDISGYVEGFTVSLSDV